MRRVGLAGSLACVLLMAGVATVQARSHVTGNDVPAMVQRTVAATLIVTPRQVDHDLEPNGPAATAGMEVDEIITASQRQAVCSRQDLARLGRRQIRATVVVTVQRSGHTFALEAALGEER